MKYFKNVINGALSDIKKIRACPGHVWIGPVKELDMNDNVIWYQVRCKRCPIIKAFGTRAEAERAIKGE